MEKVTGKQFFTTLGAVSGSQSVGFATSVATKTKVFMASSSRECLQDV